MDEYRYPGPQPFSEHQRHLFFGRDLEMGELLRLVKRVQWVVIYSKSGMGKSSLLNAGLVPRLEEIGKFTPIFVRFGSWTPDSQIFPIDIAEASLQEKNLSIPSWFADLVNGEKSLWRLLKERQLFSKHQSKVPLLVFDQFEELFTYPKEAVKNFAKALAEVFYTEIPECYRIRLENKIASSPNAISEIDLIRLHEPLSIKVISAVRNDRMALLHQLDPYLPGTLENCYELFPLSAAAAEEAILNPAYDSGAFRTPKFDYSDKAIDTLLSFLSANNMQDIESFQLQLICEYLEKNVIEKQQRNYIDVSDIATPKFILENYYLNKINEIENEEERLAARKLLEEGLIFEDEQRRISLFEGQIQRNLNLSTSLLAQLENTHLIRREPSLRGGYTYELSHDTLVEPILKAKASRLIEEQITKQKAEEALKQAELEKLKAEAEQERRKAEDEKILRKNAEISEQKAKQQRKLAQAYTRIAFILAIIAGGLLARVYTNQKRMLTMNQQLRDEERTRLQLEFRSKSQDALNFADIDCALARKTLAEMQVTVQKITDLKAELDSLNIKVNQKCPQ